MSIPILATKLYVPTPRPGAVLRSRLLEQLNEGLRRKLTLVSAPAGFGKTTLLSAWVAGCECPVAWLSMDEGDNDPVRFLTYVIAALQTLARPDGALIAPDLGEGVLAALQSPQPPAADTTLTILLNEIAAIPDPFLLVLDDYHIVDAKAIDAFLTFLLTHLPPQMHLVLATREDPPLALAKLRARGQLTELRAVDLRFSLDEATSFFNQMMGLDLPAEAVAALEARTEGWIAGLHLAAISLHGHEDVASFVDSFTGSHRFVLDYLVEEVLHQQSERVQTFLLHTAILDRLNGPLCDALLLDPELSGQETLVALEKSNLFIVPLDDERRWYRYHHLFGELLRQRLRLCGETLLTQLHIRASQWCEENGLELEAFNHAAAANDFERAERLIEGKGMPLHFRGAVAPVLNWLESLPSGVLDAWPSLWTAFASVLLVTGQVQRVEDALQAAENAFQAAEFNDKTRDLIGRVAAIRATLAASLQQPATIIAQSLLALDHLHPNNLPFRTSTAWKLGFAYHLQGDRAAARQAYAEVLSTGEATGNTIFTLMATIGTGDLQRVDNQLPAAARTYRSVLQRFGDPPLPAAGEAHLGLAQILYEWNELEEAFDHAQQALQLLRQVENSGRHIVCELLLSRLTMAQGDVAGAIDILSRVEQDIPRYSTRQLTSALAAVQVRMLLHQGDLKRAAHLAETHELPASLARVRLAQDDPIAALAALAPWRQLAEEKGWIDEKLKALVLQALIQAENSTDSATQLLSKALALAEPGGYIRLFVDEGEPMAQLLSGITATGSYADYANRVLAAFSATSSDHQVLPNSLLAPRHSPPSSLIEPLSERELEVLQLVAQGLSNREISERLFLALSTVKGHNRNIYGKLSVQRRTEAVARARELGLVV